MGRDDQIVFSKFLRKPLIDNVASLRIDVPVVKDSKHGFHPLAEIPTPDALSDYYEGHYFDPLRRAPLSENVEQQQRDLIAQS